MISYLFVSSLPAWVLILSPDSFRNRRKNPALPQEPLYLGHLISSFLEIQENPTGTPQHMHPLWNLPGDICSPGKQTLFKSQTLNFSPSLIPPSCLWLHHWFLHVVFFYCYFLPFMQLYFSLFPSWTVIDVMIMHSSYKAPNNEVLI